MSEDMYFEKKAEELINKILKSMNENGNKIVYNIVKRELYIALKEVARDQRYACVDAFQNECRQASCIDSYMNKKSTASIIQNAMIKGDK